MRLTRTLFEPPDSHVMVARYPVECVVVTPHPLPAGAWEVVAELARAVEHAAHCLTELLDRQAIALDEGSDATVGLARAVDRQAASLALNRRVNGDRPPDPGDLAGAGV